MMKSIFAWVVATYAGHTLAEVELLRAKGETMIGYGQVWNRLLGYKKGLDRTIKTRRPFTFDTSVLGKTQTVKGQPLDAGWEITVEGDKARTDHPKTDDDAVEWVQYLINEQMRVMWREQNPPTQVRGKQRKKRPGLDIEVDVAQFKTWWVELVRIQRMLQPYAKKVKRRSWAQQKFPLDLTGWKYLDQVDSEEFRDNLDRINFDEIRVVLTFKKKAGWEGLWEEGVRTLTLVAPSFPGIDYKKIQGTLGGIKDVLEHELIHVGQTVIQWGKKLKEEAGLPGRKLREEGVNPMGLRMRQDGTPGGGQRIPHELQDVEFYTRLNDTVRDFERLIKRVPDARRAAFFDNFIEKLPWFKVLREKNPRKYAKAVSELRKAVEPLLAA